MDQVVKVGLYVAQGIGGAPVLPVVGRLRTIATGIFTAPHLGKGELGVEKGFQVLLVVRAGLELVGGGPLNEWLGVPVPYLTLVFQTRDGVGASLAGDCLAMGEHFAQVACTSLEASDLHEWKSVAVLGALSGCARIAHRTWRVES